MNKIEIASLSDSRWQKRKECPNQYTNNGDIAETANGREVASL